MKIIMDEWTNLVNELASTEAHKLSGRFSMVQMEDIHGTMWEWIMKNLAKVQTCVDEGAHSTLSFYLRTEGRKFCLSEKAATEGYKVDDLYFYGSKQLYSMLSIVFQYADWQSFGAKGDGQPRAKGDPRQSSDVVAALADVSRCLSLLDERDYNTIVWRFKYEYSDEELGEALECTPSAANKRVQRAVKRLHHQLGGEDPFKEVTGARRTQSNSAARAQLSTQWEGE